MSDISVIRVACDLWETMTSYLTSVEIQDASDNFVSVLVDSHGVDPETILDIFDDEYIKKSVSVYISENDIQKYKDDYDEDYYYEDDDPYRDDYED